VAELRRSGGIVNRSIGRVAAWSSALFLAASLAFACSDDGGDVAQSTSTPPPGATVGAPTDPPDSDPISPATIIIDEPPPVPSGDIFALRVRIEGATNVGAYQLTPSYNRDALVLTDIRDADFLGSTGRTPTCSKDGIAPARVTLFCVTLGATPPGASGDGNLAILEFRATRAGSTDVRFERITLTTPDGTEVPIDARGTSVTVQ
jgi:hypothetical protein